MTWRRRTWLQAATLVPIATLTGCERTARLPYTGDWVGAAHERGHALRDALPSPGSQPASSPRRCTVLVIGAGVSGLSCARHLMRGGVDDVHVLDLEDQLGGNSRAHQMGGLPCPLGAHYLPAPGPWAEEVHEMLIDWGLGPDQAARERHLCHSPQERLWIDQQWHEGLLPPLEALPTSERHGTQAEYERFAQDIARLSQGQAFTLPTARSHWNDQLSSLDALTFGQWLDQQRYTSPALRWYLDYCCFDDYGAGSAQVSAWAGVHYFASRHGFHAPGSEVERDAVLTWPQGNAWLVERLAQSLGERWHPAHSAWRVTPGRHGVAVEVLDHSSGIVSRWQAQQVVLATPLFISARLFNDGSPAAQALQALQGVQRHAPWMVANLQVSSPLARQPGAPPSWDNLVYQPRTRSDISPHPGQALGWVDASHQNTSASPGPTVLTAYWALGGNDSQQLQTHRHRLLNDSWALWAQRALAQPASVHPDLPDKVQRIDLMRYGHAMSIPTPGLRRHPALLTLSQPAGRVHFAHSDLSGYSVFEEAAYWGVQAAQNILARNRAV